MSASPFTIKDSLELLRSGRFSDFTIKCKSTSFPVHKFMLATKSMYFDTVIDGPFKEGVENAYTCRETEPRIVAVVIAFIYTGSLVSAERIGEIWPNHFAKDVHLRSHERISIYLLADQMMLDKLKHAVCDRVLTPVSSRVNSLLREDKSDSNDYIHYMAQQVYGKVCETDNLLRPGITKILLDAESSYRPKAPTTAIAISDSESDSDTDSDISSDTDSSSDEDLDAGPVTNPIKNPVKTPVKSSQATFKTTLRKLMELAEDEDPSAVHSGRLILRDNRKKLEKLEQKVRLTETHSGMAHGNAKRRRIA